VVAAWDGGPDGDTAVLLALLLAVARALPLAVEPVDGASGRRARAVLADLRSRGFHVVEASALSTPVCRVGAVGGGPADIRVRAQEQAMRVDWGSVPLPVSTPDVAGA
jgi:hypothetical protein